VHSDLFSIEWTPQSASSTVQEFQTILEQLFR
jgi:hypothetical protein